MQRGGKCRQPGGNIFKARVYPIGSEKRIRIAYTQVLPKQGDAYRYRYALQSDLLRQHPLRRLRLQVVGIGAEQRDRLGGRRGTRVREGVRSGQNRCPQSTPQHQPDALWLSHPV